MMGHSIRRAYALGCKPPRAENAKQEELFTCPVCGRGKFTAAGLMRHNCRIRTDVMSAKHQTTGEL
jgi:transcription elongation factor Elf1